MGFYSPQSLVDDARRHGVTVLRPDINASAAAATLAETSEQSGASNKPSEWGRGGPAVRLGLKAVRSLGDKVAERIEEERRSGGPYASMSDLARRAGLSATHLEALATADAFACLGLTRREALWAAGAAAQETAGRLPGTTGGTQAPMLPGMDAVERMVADVWATGLAPDAHPAQFARPYLDTIGALSVEALREAPEGRRVSVGGIVTHRQRPATAGGVTFINLEDETGMLNVTCTPGLWQRHRKVARTANAMIVRGILEKAEGVLNLRADHLAVLSLPIRSPSRDFR
jgi:error-prone DNA polymerase